MLPWSSKSQFAMSRTRWALALPLSTSTVIARPSRCMWPETARIVPASRTGRVQLWTGPGSTGPQSRCSRSARAGRLPEPLGGVGDGDDPAAQARGAVVPAGQLDRRRQEHRLEGLLAAAGGLGEPEPDGAAVGSGAGEQVVVHLHDEPGARRQRDADVVGHHPLAAAGRPRTDPVGVVERRPRCPGSRCRRSRSTRRRGRPRRASSARATSPGSTLETMTWWTRAALSGRMSTPLTSWSLVRCGSRRKQR